MPKGKNPKRYVVLKNGREIGFAGTRAEVKADLLPLCSPYRSGEVLIKLTEPPTRKMQPIEWWGDFSVRRVSGHA